MNVVSASSVPVRGPLRAVAVEVVVPVMCAVALFLLIARGGLHAAETSLAVAIAAIAIVAAIRYPGGALGTLVVFVPLQLCLLAWAYRLGTPAALVKDLGYVKDALVGGICLAAVRNVAAGRVRMRVDVLDVCVAAYVGIATAYLALPAAFPGILGGQPFNVRINAWRLDCLFAVLLIAARRVPLPPLAIRRIRAALYVVAAILCAFGLWETFDKAGYNHFMASTIHLPAYQHDILDTTPPRGNNYVNVAKINGLEFVRVGSLFGDALGLGFYMVVPLALAVEQIAQRRVPRWSVIIALAAGLTVVQTQTRSAELSGAIAIALALRLAYRRGSAATGRLAAVTIAAALVVIPVAAHSTVWPRLQSAFAGNSNTDNQIHSTSSTGSYRYLVSHPLGKGLGANPVTGTRFSTDISTHSESSYLQVGIELGLAGMIAFIAMYLALLWQLFRRARAPDASGGLAGAMWLAGMGFAAGGFYLHIWIGLAVSLTFWGLSGTALAAADGRHAHRARGLSAAATRPAAASAGRSGA